MAKLWNEETKKYDSYDLPKGACAYSPDMDKKVACARCGKKLKYGDCYTSTQIYGDNGLFGFAICQKCAEKEWESQKKPTKKGRR